MIRFLPYIVKTLWRHRSRTVLTLAGSAVALFVFCFVGAVQEGMEDLRERQAGERSLIVFQANKFCPATSQLPEDYTEQIETLPGVERAVPIQVFTNNCRASLDVVVFYGVPAQEVRRIRDFRLVNGSWAEFEARSNQNAAIVGRAVAERRGGQGSLSIGGVTVEVAGVYESDDPAEENYIYTHLGFLQRRHGRDLQGRVTQIEVHLDESADAVATAGAIDKMFQSGQVETDTRPKGAFQLKSLGDLSQLISMSRYLGLACVGLVLALVGTTTLMSVQDRVKEHAVLQTIGFTGGEVFGLVLIESAVLSVFGGGLGVAAAAATLQLVPMSVGAEAVTIAFQATGRLAVLGVVVSLLVGVLAGIPPAWHASRTDLVAALRGA
ncbi:MAG: ABC transporter permease [Planctomycetota bacterium]|nr:ABC transporter permease [Planctomycetota bacterium]